MDSFGVFIHEKKRISPKDHIASPPSSLLLSVWECKHEKNRKISFHARSRGGSVVDRGVLLFKKYNETVENGNTAGIRHVYMNAAGATSVKEEMIKDNGEFTQFQLPVFFLNLS